MRLFRSKHERTQEHIAQLEHEMRIGEMGSSLVLDDGVIPEPYRPRLNWESKSGALELLAQKIQQRPEGITLRPGQIWPVQHYDNVQFVCTSAASPVTFRRSLEEIALRGVE